jgi:hypothetical protein
MINKEADAMGFRIEYPCFGSGAPKRLSAEAIRTLASDLRQQLLGYAAKPFDPGELFRRAARLCVNGRHIRIAWDAAHAVHDRSGEPVLGVCEHDPQEPTMVMISLNAALLGKQPELMRSTAAHELGHAIFDMPAAMAKGISRTFHSSQIATADSASSDWPEWRAGEFMGGFLTPRRQLTRSFTRQASLLGLPLRWRGDRDVPRPFMATGEVGGSAIDAITSALAEEIGLSEAFIAVRLQKYQLVTNR